MSNHSSRFAESYTRTSFQIPSLSFSARHMSFFVHLRGVTKINETWCVSSPREFLTRFLKSASAFLRRSFSTLIFTMLRRLLSALRFESMESAPAT